MCGRYASFLPAEALARFFERACQLTLRIVAMDRKFAKTGAQTDHDSRTYLAWSNSLSGYVFLPCAHALLLDISIIHQCVSILPRRVRMIEKEPQHLSRRIWPARVRVGARCTAAGPGVAASMHDPLL
jgi:hypothetical protein